MLENKKERYSLRKLSVGLASVLVGTAIFGVSQKAKADMVTPNMQSQTSQTEIKNNTSNTEKPVQQAQIVQKINTQPTAANANIQNQQEQQSISPKTAPKGYYQYSDNQAIHIHTDTEQNTPKQTQQEQTPVRQAQQSNKASQNTSYTRTAFINARPSARPITSFVRLYGASLIQQPVAKASAPAKAMPYQTKAYTISTNRSSYNLDAEDQQWLKENGFHQTGAGWTKLTNVPTAKSNKSIIEDDSTSPQQIDKREVGIYGDQTPSGESDPTQINLHVDATITSDVINNNHGKKILVTAIPIESNAKGNKVIQNITLKLNSGVYDQHNKLMGHLEVDQDDTERDVYLIDEATSTYAPNEEIKFDGIFFNDNHDLDPTALTYQSAAKQPYTVKFIGSNGHVSLLTYTYEGQNDSSSYQYSYFGAKIGMATPSTRWKQIKINYFGDNLYNSFTDFRTHAVYKIIGYNIDGTHAKMIGKNLCMLVHVYPRYINEYGDLIQGSQFDVWPQLPVKALPYGSTNQVVYDQSPDGGISYAEQPDGSLLVGVNVTNSEITIPDQQLKEAVDGLLRTTYYDPSSRSSWEQATLNAWHQRGNHPTFLSWLIRGFDSTNDDKWAETQVADMTPGGTFDGEAQYTNLSTDGLNGTAGNARWYRYIPMEYIDDDNGHKQIGEDILQGITGKDMTVNLNNANIPTHYIAASSQPDLRYYNINPKTNSFDYGTVQDNNSYNRAIIIHVKHAIKAIPYTHSTTRTIQIILPAASSYKLPQSYINQYGVTGSGKTFTITEHAEFDKTDQQDEVTQKIVKNGAWQTNTKTLKNATDNKNGTARLTAVQLQQIPGYTTKVVTVPAKVKNGLIIKPAMYLVEFIAKPAIIIAHFGVKPNPKPITTLVKL